MKYTMHVPVESYGFIEIELEGESADAVKKYYETKSAFDNFKQEVVCEDIDIQNKLNIAKFQVDFLTMRLEEYKNKAKKNEGNNKNN